MRYLTEALVPKRFEQHQQPVVTPTAGTGFCYVMGSDGEPERLAGPLICVPLLNDIGGDEGVAKVLVAAGQGNTLTLGDPKALAETGGFWQKQPTPRVILANPGLVGRFFQPGFQVFPLDVIPEGTLLLLRPPMMVGYLVSRGPERGVLVYCKDGILTVRFATW
jgi:hypothetical protein